jgi:glycosyltransferase involved in cell wall biosynthesis
LDGTQIVHIHELRSTTSVFAYRAATRANIPYVLSPHGGLRHLGKTAAKAAFDAFWGKRILSEAAMVLAASPIEERDAQEFGIQSGRIRRLPNSIDLAEFHDLPARDAFRSRLGLGSGKVVLFLGRLHRIKGPDILLAAFEIVLKKEPSVRLVVAGPDDGQGSELRGRVNALGMNHAVTFTGFLNESQKREALTGSCVLVVPSRSEVFAISAIESLACGTPVILSSACGLYPLPRPEHGVIPFETENPNDLAEKLSMMAGPTAFRHNVSAGRDFVRREFSPHAVAGKAAAIYEEIVL